MAGPPGILADRCGGGASVTGACRAISSTIQSMNTRSFALTCRFCGYDIQRHGVEPPVAEQPYQRAALDVRLGHVRRHP